MWLKELRQIFNKTQKEVANESGINKFTIENIEQLRRQGSSETIKLLLEYFYNVGNFSYDCGELIEELKKDIEEFGDITFYAMFEIKENNFYLTNYDFISEDKPLSEEEKEKYSFILKLKGSDILELLQIQNKII